jgi:hypothetical protein
MNGKTRINLQCVNASDIGVKYTETRRAIWDKSVARKLVYIKHNNSKRW